MWKVYGLSKAGERVELRDTVFAGEAPSAQLVREVAGGLGDGFAPALSHLSEEARQARERPLPWRDSLSLWGSDIEKELAEFGYEPPYWFGDEDDIRMRLHMQGPDLGLFARIEGEDVQIGSARHARLFFVIPARLEFEAYEIEWDEKDAEETGLPAGRIDDFDYVVEWRAYFGEQSAIMDGLSALRRRITGGLERTARIAMGGAGVIVGTVLAGWCWLMRRQMGDPARHVRRLWFDRMLKSELGQCKDLRDLGDAQAEKCAIVLVHGTISCAGAIIAQLPAGATRGWHRFEHDTFKPVAANAERLAELLQQKLPQSRVLLVSHSRGGLVSTLAAMLLQKRGRRDIEVFAVGTPFGGTPVAMLGGAAIGLFARLGSMSIQGVAQCSLVTAALARILAFQSGAPRGISDMCPGESFLAALPLAASGVAGTTYGAAFDINGAQTAMGAFAVSAAGKIFSGAPNDLVVALASTNMSTWPAGKPLGCGHTEYFREPSLLDEIRMWGLNCAVDAARAGGRAAPPVL